MDGSGSLGAEPALVNNDLVTGDTSRLIRVLLEGAAEIPQSRRVGYYNVMPAFDSLNDREVADVVTYIRATYGHQFSPISTKEVHIQRMTK